MIHISGAPEISKRRSGAIWIGYAACAWGALFALAHLYWGIEGTATGVLTTFTGSIKAPSVPNGGGSLAWIMFAGMLCILGMLVVWFRFWADRTPRWMQLSVIGGAWVTMTTYVVYSAIVNNLAWMLACSILCAFGAVIALALIQPWGRIIPRWQLLLLAWLGGGILIMHELLGALMQGLAVSGVISWRQEHILIGAPVTQASETVQQVLSKNLLWGTWFLLGGILFCVLAWLARHQLNDSPSR